MSTAEKLEQFIGRAHAEGFFNGAWLLSENGAVTGEGALGTADLSGRKLDTDAVFELASVSKQFTAAGIMLLRDRGLLALDDPLDRYFPRSPYGPSVTVRHLLNHTSGLPDYDAWVMKRAAETGGIPAAGVMEDFLYESGAPASFPPGEKWEYCNTGYALLALITEKVSGKPWRDFLREELFLPAGMESTTVYHRRLESGRVIPDYAYGTVWENGSYRCPDDTEAKSYVVPLDGIEGDGSVNSTLHDMFLWDRALRNGSVLSLSTQEEMRQPARLNDGRTYPYGFGWMLDIGRWDGLSSIRHTGIWPGYRTLFLRFLDRDGMFVYMLNREGPDSVADSVMREGLLDTVLGREALPPAKTEELLRALPDAEFARIAGTYAGSGAEVSIRRGEGGIPAARLSLGGAQMCFEIVSAGNGVYFTVPDGLRFECDGSRITQSGIGTMIKTGGKET